MWRIWSARNSFVHNAKVPTCGEVVGWSKAFLQDFIAAGASLECNRAITNNVPAWCRPPRGAFKLNVDACVCAQVENAG
ncbi:hypothetical protein ACOSP7_003313 [Xanthoceras sorbifolium]